MHRFRSRARTSRTIAIAAVAAVAIGVAGCGGSSSSDDVEAANSQVVAAASSAQDAANQAVSQAQGAASEIASAASSAAAALTAAASEEVAAASSAAEAASSVAAEAGDTAVAEEEGDTAEVEVVKGPYEKGGFALIVRQLEDELGYSPDVLEVVLSEDFAQFQVRDRKKPKNVDQYEWRAGELSDPVPVRLVGDGALGENVFPLESLRTDVPAKLKKAGEALSIEGAAVSTMIAKRMLPFSTDVRWLVNVSGTREDKQLRATTKGKVVETV